MVVSNIRRLPGHTHPRDDELLSSWLVRLAAQNGLKLHGFCQMIAPGTAVWNRDIDNSASEDLIGRLSRRTGTAAERVRQTTLASFEGLLFERHNPQGTTKWLLPLGIYHRTRRRSGLTFCPECLTEPVPYYRRSWRLALSVMCLRHCSPLVDSCSCGAPINFHRGDLGNTMAFSADDSMTRCYRCRRDLRRQTVDPQPLTIMSGALRAQRLCETAITRGFIALGEEHDIHSTLFFSGLRQLIQISCNGRFAGRLRSSVATWRGMEGFAPSRESRHGTLERQSVTDRLQLMAIVDEWLEDWPAAFVSCCKRSGLTATDICRNLTYVPYWLSKVVEKHFSRLPYSPTLPEISNAIAYLRKRDIVATRKAVSQLLGATDVFRKRKLLYLLEQHSTTSMSLFDDDATPDPEGEASRTMR